MTKEKNKDFNLMPQLASSDRKLLKDDKNMHVFDDVKTMTLRADLNPVECDKLQWDWQKMHRLQHTVFKNKTKNTIRI